MWNSEPNRVTCFGWQSTTSIPSVIWYLTQNSNLERSIEHKTRTMAWMGRHPKILAAPQQNNQFVSHLDPDHLAEGLFRPAVQNSDKRQSYMWAHSPKRA